MARGRNYYNRNNLADKLKSDKNWVLDSPARNANAHMINLMCFLAGTTLQESAFLTTAQGEMARANEIESADKVTLRLQTNDKLPLLFYSTHSCKTTRDSVVTVEGDKGRLVWDFHKSLVFRGIDGSREEYPVTDFDTTRSLAIKSVVERVSNPEGFICTLATARNQVLAVNALHRSAIIQNAPADLIYHQLKDKENYTLIKGIDSILTDCFEKNLLPLENGINWFKKGQIVDLVNFHEFSGPLIPTRGTVTQHSIFITKASIQELSHFHL